MLLVAISFGPECQWTNGLFRFWVGFTDPKSWRIETSLNNKMQHRSF